MSMTLEMQGSTRTLSDFSLEATYTDEGFVLNEASRVESDVYRKSDTPRPRRSDHVRSTLTASKLHKISPLFPKTGLPSRDKQTADYLEYKNYLEHSISELKIQAEYFGYKIRVDSGQLLKELPVWESEDVVWPNILHNGEGGVVLHWVANSLNLRIERYADARFKIQSWHSLNILNEIESEQDSGFDPEYYLREVVPAVYAAIAKEYHPDWKSFFEPRD